MSPLERDIEIAVIEYAHRMGCLYVKLNIVGRVGWPDRMFLYHGKVLFIEFKRPGERVRAIQQYIHKQLRQQGFNVEVVDSITNGKHYIDILTEDSKNV